jgi:hypothetical protein
MKPVLHSFAYALDYLRDLVADVPPADMVRQPPAIPNHPAWTIGHLTFSCQLLGGVIGLEKWLPRDWAKRYGTGSVPTADTSLYEPKEKLLAILSDAQPRLTRAVEQFPELRLDQPFPEPSYLHVFPTIRHALTQVLVGHTSMLVGQLTVWRRAMGLPKLSRVFD